MDLSIALGISKSVLHRRINEGALTRHSNAIKPQLTEETKKARLRFCLWMLEDNARPHIDPLDDKFLAVAQGDGFDIRLTCQPPNSPNFNVLDLEYFRSIQSLQYREAPKTIDGLVLAVTKSFGELSPSALNRVFLTFQECIIEVMKFKGGKNYKIPHMKKDHLEKEGCLPVTLSCDHGLLREVVDYLES
ncbi:hypothetical protein LIER_07300 [Lithospermum erythrorhizon]|uniref:Transposase n=1 Tax=Lithospermum erythrorhizon TaxID=34254 RepID=A0AAV3PA72_LITER